MWPVLMSARAQVPQANASEPESILVSDVTFSGDRFFDDDQLLLYVRTRPNRELLGIPGFTWWLWLHRFGENTLGGGRIGRVFTATGEAPALYDSTIVSSDVEQLRLFYEREGFRSAEVTARTHLRDPDRIDVEFLIDAGPPTFIRTVRFNGLDSLRADEKLEVTSESLLPAQAIDPDEPLVYQAEALRYSAPLLLEEGRRLTAWLRDAGFAAVDRDSLHAVVYPVREDSFDVTFDVRLGPRYRFGDLFYEITGPQSGVQPRTDRLELESSDPDVEGGVLTATFTDEKVLDFSLLTRTLQFMPGDWYNQSLLLATKRRLDASGVFYFTGFGAPLADPDSLTPPRLDHVLQLRTRVRHQIRFETFMLQRSGALADTDNELGAGLGVTYLNQNLFGGGESFRLRSTGSLAADLGGLGGFTSSQWEVNASLSYPYLTFPLGSIDRRASLYEARSEISVSLLAARRDALRLILRSRGGARYRFELRHNERLTSIVDLVDITLSNPDTLSGFREIFLDDVLGAVDDAVQRAQIIEDYTRPQFNNALRYTLRSTTVDPFRRTSGHLMEGSVELGGNMGYLMDRFLFSPDTLEGSIPGLLAGGGQSRMIYRQYVRLMAEARRYQPLGSRTVFAWKVLGGFAQPTSRVDVVPFDRRFYSGGASSVRAWRLRELGPGSATFVSESDSVVTEGTNILGGEVKLEASAELRTTIIRTLLGADWIATFFADAGNVWLGPRNPGSRDGRFRFDTFPGELGVGAGFGLRLAWDYLIVRLDAAYKVHDPRRQGRILPDGLSEPVLQFGIGHTF